MFRHDATCLSDGSPESQDLEVHFSQFEFGDSGPASPDKLPSVKELSEGLKAAPTSALHGQHTVATDDNPDRLSGMRSAAKLHIRYNSLDGTDEEDTRGSHCKRTSRR